MDTDRDILDQVGKLVAEEHDLRDRLAKHGVDETEEHTRLRSLEVQLDQCWDLLRQRRARREAGQDPDGASARPGDQVEGYLS